MNLKLINRGCFALVLATFLFAPWKSVTTFASTKTTLETYSHAPIWDTPFGVNKKTELQVGRLAMYWAAIGFFYFVSRKMVAGKVE